MLIKMNWQVATLWLADRNVSNGLRIPSNSSRESLTKLVKLPINSIKGYDYSIFVNHRVTPQTRPMIITTI